MSADHAYLSDERMRELLQPLLENGNNLDIEYKHQYKMLTEFSKRLQSLESQYAQVYSKMTQLEQELAKVHKNGAASPHSTLWENFS